MGDIIETSTNSIESVENETGILELTEGLLAEARTAIRDEDTLKVPIAELAALGSGVSSLIPKLKTVTQTTTLETKGLYQLANMASTDTLKVAKNGNYWGAFKTQDGASKFLQLKEAGPISSTTKTSVPIDPATMMMAAALFSIEQELGQIAEMEKQILSFLEIEKEAEIEADVETLMGIITKYKLNWDNEPFVANNHKLVLDIQRTARKNMNAYQKQLEETLKSKQLIVAQGTVNSTLSSFEKKFQYYRLSLYNFALASMTEIMLSGNFKEEYITGIKDEIQLMSDKYMEMFSNCSAHLEKMGTSALETYVVKGIGNAGKALGKFIGNIPRVKDGNVDEFLQDKGQKMLQNAADMEKKAVKSFESIGNPETKVFIEKMDDIVRIYNHTSKICFDDDNIYLLA